MDYEKHSICLIFAANKYPNAEQLPNLSCAVNDGMLVAETLCGLKPTFFDGTEGDGVWESPATQDNNTLGQGFQVKMFIDHAVTREAIDKELMTLISHYKTPQIGPRPTWWQINPSPPVGVQKTAIFLKNTSKHSK